MIPSSQKQKKRMPQRLGHPLYSREVNFGMSKMAKKPSTRSIKSDHRNFGEFEVQPTLYIIILNEKIEDVMKKLW